MKIVAVDFDGTLCRDAWPEIGSVNKPMLLYIKSLKARGYKVILNTMREGSSLDAAVEWCRVRGLEFDAVNDNLPEMQEKYGNNPRKVYADYYIDDHNVNGFGVSSPGRGRRC